MNAISTGVNSEENSLSAATSELSTFDSEGQIFTLEDLPDSSDCDVWYSGRNDGFAPEDLHFVCSICSVDMTASTTWLAGLGVDLPALFRAPDAFQFDDRLGAPTLLYRAPEFRDSLLQWQLDEVGLELLCVESRYYDWLARNDSSDKLRFYDWRIGLDWKSLPALPAELLKVWIGLNDSGYPSEAPIADTLTEMPSAVSNAQQAKTVEHGDEWPEPQSFDRGVAESAPFPLDALPGIVGAAVAEYQDFGQQPLGLVASSALSVVSLVTQGLADVQRDSRLSGPMSLNFLVVAPSGERKTAADRAMGGPLAEWEQARAEEMKPDIAANRAAIQAWKAKVDGIEAAIRNAMGKSPERAETLSAQLPRLMQDKPAELVASRLRYEDVNPQSLVAALATGHPSAAIWSDEGGMVTGSHGMGRDSFLGFMALLNRLWDGGSIRHDRKQAASVHLQGRRFTVSLMLQPTVLREMLQRGDGLSRGSGFMARFLVASPASTMGTRFYRAPSPNCPRQAEFHSRVRELLGQPLPLNPEGCLQPPLLVLSPGAFDIWREYHDNVEAELRPLGDYITVCDFAAKSAENAARLAGCLHVFLGRQGAIQADLMDAGTTLARWYLNESLRLMDMLEEPPAQADARKLDAWLEERGACSHRDVLQYGPKCVREKKRRDAALDLLTELGRARIEHQDGREVIVRNPALCPVATATPANPATADPLPDV